MCVCVVCMCVCGVGVCEHIAPDGWCHSCNNGGGRKGQGVKRIKGETEIFGE